ncbi:MAG TPA: hypothetical protein VL989_02875 [Candidatus Sulfotelmatobacter sp.]|nr:hypothetical protein [Candidatus Sulfotelmatobacter sp.]
MSGYVPVLELASRVDFHDFADGKNLAQAVDWQVSLPESVEGDIELETSLVRDVLWLAGASGCRIVSYNGPEDAAKNLPSQDDPHLETKVHYMETDEHKDKPFGVTLKRPLGPVTSTAGTAVFDILLNKPVLASNVAEQVRFGESETDAWANELSVVLRAALRRCSKMQLLGRASTSEKLISQYTVPYLIGAEAIAHSTTGLIAGLGVFSLKHLQSYWRDRRVDREAHAHMRCRESLFPGWQIDRYLAAVFFTSNFVSSQLVCTKEAVEAGQPAARRTSTSLNNP